MIQTSGLANKIPSSLQQSTKLYSNKLLSCCLKRVLQMMRFYDNQECCCLYYIYGEAGLVVHGFIKGLLGMQSENPSAKGDVTFEHSLD